MTTLYRKDYLKEESTGRVIYDGSKLVAKVYDAAGNVKAHVPVDSVETGAAWIKGFVTNWKEVQS